MSQRTQNKGKGYVVKESIDPGTVRDDPGCGRRQRMGPTSEFTVFYRVVPQDIGYLLPLLAKTVRFQARSMVPIRTPGAPAYGTEVTTLPSGAVARNVRGTMAYGCSSVWYRPYFGSNSMDYEVMSPPPVYGSASS